MDKEPKTRKEKKGDKAKRTHELNGCFSQKHVRLVEALAAKRNPVPKTKR